MNILSSLKTEKCSWHVLAVLCKGFGTDDYYFQYCFLAFIMFPASFSLILISISEINTITKIYLRKNV